MPYSVENNAAPAHVPRPDRGSMTGEQQRELNRICDAFEYAHREMDESPQWYKFLGFGTRSIQAQLAYELIRLEQFYNRSKGVFRTEDQYLEECSDFGKMVRAAIRDEKADRHEGE